MREAVTLIAGGATLWTVLRLFPTVVEGGRPAVLLAEPVPGLEFALEVEPLGLLFALVASSLWIVTSIYSIGYMRGHHEREPDALLPLLRHRDLERPRCGLLGKHVHPLHLLRDPDALDLPPGRSPWDGESPAARDGSIWGVLLSTSIGLQLLAIVWTWSLAGTLDFTQGGILRDHAGPATASILLVLYVFGIGKAAVMPFHRWLPAAMVAPTPVSALLHAVAVVKSGVFAILKVSVYIFGIDFLSELGATSG